MGAFNNLGEKELSGKFLQFLFRLVIHVWVKIDIFSYGCFVFEFSIYSTVTYLSSTKNVNTFQSDLIEYSSQQRELVYIQRMFNLKHF